MKKSRRQFLQNTSAAGLFLGFLGCARQTVAGTPATENPKTGTLQACRPTTLDLFGEGPFYTQNPPAIENAALAAAQEPGERMLIRGRLLNLDCSQILPNTVIDVWHANAAGQYDNAGHNLRGQTLTDDQGYYSFETVKPGKYLNGLRFRPAHIHFKITPPGGQTLTTQLYFDGDSDLPSDAATRIESGRFDARDRIITLSPKLDGRLEGIFDIVVTE